MLTGVEDKDSRQGAPAPEPLLPAQPSPLLTNLPGPSVCATSNAFKVGQSWGGVFWNEAIYSLSLCEFQDDHRLSNTELEQKYGTNIIRVSHQGTECLGDKHPDHMRKNAGLRRLWVT